MVAGLVDPAMEFLSIPDEGRDKDAGSFFGFRLSMNQSLFQCHNEGIKNRVLRRSRRRTPGSLDADLTNFKFTRLRQNQLPQNRTNRYLYHYSLKNFFSH